MPSVSELVNFAFFMGCRVLSGDVALVVCLLCVLTRVPASGTD